MPSPTPETSPPSASRAVFLSYAREDSAAAQRLAEALRAAGIEVWFDQSELVGGDAWDAKIRHQIKTCALFMPVISAATQARREGYFRIEWKLAAQRTHAIADGTPFLLPVVIDATGEGEALVPVEFREVQWTRLVSGDPGEKFCARVAKLLGREAAPASARQSDSAGRVTARRSDRTLAAWISAGLVLAAIGFGWVWQRNHQAAENGGSDTRPPATTAPEKSVAVLPFEGDKENETFSDGVSDELLTVLGKVPGLTVKGRQSSFAFKGQNLPEAEIARKLGVAYIVNGTVRRSGSEVRITARLNRAADGNQIWSDKFTEELKDIFAVQDKIAGLIAENLQLRLGSAARVAKSVDPEAHRLALEGRYFWTLRSDEDLARAESAYVKALAIDPKFAEAHAGLADVWVVRGWYDSLAGLEVGLRFEQAREQAEMALQIDGTLAEPWAALGAVNHNEWKFAEAEEAFQNAQRLNTNYSYAHHWHAHLLAARGRLDESLVELDRATKLDPLAMPTLVIHSLHLQYVHRYAEALAMSERALVLSPNFAACRASRAYSLLKLGRREQALTEARALAKDPALKPRWWTDALVVAVLRESGQQAEAEEFVPRLVAGMGPTSSARALVLATLGKIETALDEMSRIRPAASAIGLLYYSESTEALRRHPRFLEVMAQLGCAENYQAAQSSQVRILKELAARK